MNMHEQVLAMTSSVTPWVCCTQVVMWRTRRLVWLSALRELL